MASFHPEGRGGEVAAAAATALAAIAAGEDAGTRQYAPRQLIEAVEVVAALAVSLPPPPAAASSPKLLPPPTAEPHENALASFLSAADTAEVGATAGAWCQRLCQARAAGHRWMKREVILSRSWKTSELRKAEYYLCLFFYFFSVSGRLCFSPHSISLLSLKKKYKPTSPPIDPMSGPEDNANKQRLKNSERGRKTR